jgi:hypothetical protein
MLVQYDQETDNRTQAWWVSLLCYVLTLSLTKVSICLLYLTIFTFEWARRACYAVLAIVIITNLWAIAVTFTYCIPLEATWDPTVKASFCQNQETWWGNSGLASLLPRPSLSFSVLTSTRTTSLIIATDLLIFLLPIPFVLPLKLPRRQKVIVVGVFAVGFL